MDRCENCKFHRMTEDGKETYISCHRYSPSGCASAIGRHVLSFSVFPEAKPYDWCGEYIRGADEVLLNERSYNGEKL